MNYANNNYFRFSYNYYEKHLSTFGKKVLQTLIHNFHKEHESYKNPQVPQHIPVQKKKILQFRDSNSNTNRPPSRHQLYSQNELNINNEPNIRSNENPSEGTIKSTELLKIIDYNDIGTDNLTREDLVLSVNLDHRNDEVYDIYSYESCDKNVDANIQHNYEIIANEANTVAWDDIFDTELLVADANIIEQSAVLQNNEDGLFSFDISHSNNENINSNKKNVSNTTEFVNKNNKKRKKQIPCTEKPVKPKKIKDNDNSFLRKQKCTKAVKNWLNDVNPNNPINPIEEEVKAKKPKNQNTKMNKNYIEKTNNMAQKKKSKKIVQAQLANKDGVMKFGKPKNEDLNKVNENTASNPEGKEKRVKAKFVAPIKSQILVKELTYEIHILNGSDFIDLPELKNEVDKECSVLLVYSNNFNQLNCHHTEDSCEVDGLMIEIDNVFYFLKGDLEDSKEIVTNILEFKLICYEAKDIINYLASKLNMMINPTHLVDVKIGGSLLNPDDPPNNFSEVQKLSFTPQYTIATECSLQKAAWYITLLKDCVVIMTDMLMQQSLWNVFVNVEMRLLPVIAAMEHRGVTVDLVKLKSMENVLISKIKEVEQNCYKAAGRPFQINSPLQIRAILYDELQLDTKCNVKIRETLCKGAKSTSETMLRSLMCEHPLPRLILEYRHLHKAHATFLSGIAHHVKDGVVKPTWVQTAAVTGRIASNNPNLQAIPKAPFSLVMFPQDIEEKDVPLVRFRSVYTSRAGYRLVSADFKHVECRVFAHLAADTSLSDALRTKHDLFRVLAAKWLQKPESEISSEDRERTKRIIYASLYGAGSRKLMDILNISYDQTLAIVASFNRTFPSLKSFGRSVVSRCEQNGGRLSTICGRARQFKYITSDDFALRSQAERQAVNFIVQGSAADLCKMAMIETNEQLSMSTPPVEAHLLLQIHDELVWEVKHDHLEQATSIIKRVMEKCGRHCGMATDLPVELHTGQNWAEMTEHYT